jgi:16S rRNA (guanine527-N7)-methyltransferase
VKIAAPLLRMVLVESRGRKCAFLREAVRQLELTGVEIEHARVENLAGRPEFRGAADLVTVRGVAQTQELRASILTLARRGGRVFWFGGRLDDELPELIPGATREVVRLKLKRSGLPRRRTLCATKSQAAKGNRR